MQAYRRPTFSDVPCKFENIIKHDLLGLMQWLKMEVLEVCPSYYLFME